MNRRILLVAATTGYQLRMFGEAARRAGFDPILATDRCHVLEDPWADGALPVRFEEPEASAASVAGALAAHPPAGVTAVGDRATTVAALAAERLGLAFHPAEAARNCASKHLTRERFRQAGLPVPTFQVLPAHEGSPPAPAMGYPCVLKPLHLAASQGVIRANTRAEYVEAFGRIRALLDTPPLKLAANGMPPQILVEEYIPGREFALEGVLTQGSLRAIALFDKPDPLEGPFFEESIYVTPARVTTSEAREMEAAVRAAVAALGLRHGPVHAEMRLNQRGVSMLEVAARPIGGLCARAIRFEGGRTLEEFLLRHAAGEDVESWRLEPGASGVMMIPVPRAGVYRGVAGLDRCRAVPGLDEAIITASEGQHLLPWPEGSSYPGFLFARAATPDAVEAALRQAHACLTFDIVARLPVMAGAGPKPGATPPPHRSRPPD